MTQEGHFSKCLTGTNLLLVLTSLLDHLAEETEAQRDEGLCGGDTIGRWWGWIWTRAHAGVKSKAGQSESRSWCKVRLTSQSGGRVYGVSSIWANPNPLLHGQCLQLFHPQAEASKIECKSGICERTVDLASQHETLLTERWLSLLPWGRKMTWFSSQATPLLQMNYYTRIKNSFSCKNRLLLLEPPATFFFSLPWVINRDGVTLPSFLLP